MVWKIAKKEFLLNLMMFKSALPLFQPRQSVPSRACFGRALALAGWQDWSESFWWFGNRHNQFS